MIYILAARLLELELKQHRLSQITVSVLELLQAHLEGRTVTAEQISELSSALDFLTIDH